MDLSLSQPYEDLRQEVRAFLDEHRDEAVSEREEASVERSTSWQQKLVEAGYAARNVPVEYGGRGAEPDLLADVVIAEEFARQRVSQGMRNQGIDMLVPTLLEYGSEEQKRTWVPPTVAGRLIWCQGYSEPGSGSDLASLRTRAERRGDRFVVNGQKIWTSTAQSADMMFALVRTDPDAKKHAGISYLLLSMDTPGIEVRPLKTMTGEASFNEVFFDDAEVPAENLVGDEGQGWEIGTYLLRFERGMLGSPALSENYYRGCLDALRTSGKLEDPTFRDRLMSLRARLLANKYHGMRLLSDRLEGRDSGVSALIVKLNGCQLNYDLCSLALDAYRERGLLVEGSDLTVDDGAWQRSQMMSLGLIIGGGTAQIQKNIISEVGLGMPREPRRRVS